MELKQKWNRQMTTNYNQKCCFYCGIGWKWLFRGGGGNKYLVWGVWTHFRLLRGLIIKFDRYQFWLMSKSRFFRCVSNYHFACFLNCKLCSSAGNSDCKLFWQMIKRIRLKFNFGQVFAAQNSSSKIYQGNTHFESHCVGG